MEGPPAKKKGRAAHSGQSPRQLSRLCQACLSVLTSENLELREVYSHHNDLKGFVVASRMRCYICSWLFAALSQDSQERLGLLAEGRLPGDMVVRGANLIDGRDFSDERAKLSDFIQKNVTPSMRKKPSEDETGASFTVMEIEPRPWIPKTISVLLNPSYEGYFPLLIPVYDGWLRELWETVTSELSTIESTPRGHRPSR